MKHYLLSLLTLWCCGSTLLAQNVIRGPYLQSGGPNSMILKWRTDHKIDTRVWIGTERSNLDRIISVDDSENDHEVFIDGLQADTKYFYAVGTSNGPLEGASEQHYFITSPDHETVKPVRAWVLGDCGTGNSNARKVRDAYYEYVGEAETDLILLLGDNAYPNGTDSEYQKAIFQNMYEDILLRTPMWSCPGNHDYHSVDYHNKTGPYYDIFSFPTNGEIGGLPSGTEAYYSFDYANIHFISLDSHASGRDPGDPMLVWLENDINATNQDWIIVIFHHPPYTKGTHDSDSESNHIDMREYVLPILEAGGVDLVLGGHSHNYERSYLLNGHYDYSYTFQSWMAKDQGDGRLDGNGAYQKTVEGTDAGEGAVYIVTGSAGKAAGAGLNHPAMYYSSSELGSVSLEIAGDQLDLKFINDEGEVSDYFTLRKDGLPSGSVPQVSLERPMAGQTFSIDEVVTIDANASDSDGTISKVEFMINGAYEATDYDAPYSTDWSPNATGIYRIQAKAFDDEGNNRLSTAVAVVVNNDEPSEIITTFCPENIEVDCEDPNGTSVVWDDPIFETNCTIITQDCEQVAITGAKLIGSFEGHNYYISTESKTWKEAQRFSQLLGAHLAVINSAAENDFIRNNMEVNTAWIGLTDEISEGNFQWVDGAALSYTNWGEWQPSNSNDEEHYVQIDQNGEWFDKTNYAQAFILEIACSGGTGSSYVSRQVEGIAKGERFPEGTSMVVYEATNQCGDVARCSFEITVTTCESEPTDCASDTPLGFERIAESTASVYYLSKEKDRWADALIIAQDMGGHLVHIESEIENNLLLEAIKDLDIVTLIGLSDHVTEEELAWSNGTSVTFNQLDADSNSPANNFGTLNPWTGRWELVNEWVHKRFIVEVPCAVTTPRQGWLEQKVNIQEGNQLMIYPNPVKDEFNILFDGLKTTSNGVLMIYQANGKELFQQEITVVKGTNQITWATNDLNVGVYYAQVKTDQFVKIGKFIKQ